MRVLFLTNFYQVSTGGEEQSCQQVVEGLGQRGHTTLVLTSMQGTNNEPVEEDGVYRSLYLEMDMVPLRHSFVFFTQRKSREQHNLQVFERVVEQFSPDIIFIWGMWNLPYSLAALAELRYPDKVVYRFATYWPTLPSQHEMYWRAPGRSWYGRLIKQILGRVALAMLSKEKQRPALTFRHAICVSAATRDALISGGVPLHHAQVIHTGLDVDRFLDDGRRQVRDADRPLNLLYAGRLTPDKGIETAIKAMAKIVHAAGRQGVHLNLVGSGSADYERYLRDLVTQEALNPYVSFLGWVSAESMPELLLGSHVLVVPSVWPEPFARIVLEGMASGLVVVATPSGGTTEILSDGENGLLFAAGDADDLAKKIGRLAADPELCEKLAQHGRQTVMSQFTKTRMMDQVEDYLATVASMLNTQTFGQLERV